MVVIRSVNEIILSLIDFFKLAQPDLDTKPGSVARDLVIDAPANYVGLLYDQLSQVSTQQSLRLVIGSDLDKLAKNFGVVRKSATPASGVALLTFSAIQSTVNVNKGDLVIASNGFAYSVLNGISISPSLINFYRSIATKFRNDLDFVGIPDQYAVEVTVQSTTNGVAGNIGKYSLVRTSIAGVSNVTNTSDFSGGSNQEDDSTFRNRVLSIFNGSSVGTALGYKNAALATNGVTDAYVVQPGDILMTRDGTIVGTDGYGNPAVISEGSGGKVDVVVLGSNLVENTDSFVYHDKSNNNDPTSTKNIFVLGQIAADANKTVNRRRIDDIANGQLPNQPVDSILQVTGSISGSNFVPKTTDANGVVSGNFELIKDTGIYGGSPFGSDSFHFTSNQISDFPEDRVKGKFNGQDAVTFPDVLEIPQVQQNISITNENSTVLTSNRSLIQLLHSPATNVTRVFNVNTGERYTVVNQNPNGTGTINTSGTIQISGNTLPSPSDVLQVDYNWVITYDQYSDYDGRKFTDNLRPVTDSTDWGYSNLVRSEKVNFTRNTSSTLFSGTTVQPISSIISANVFSEYDGYVTFVTSGTFAGRLSVVISNLLIPSVSVDNIFFKNTFTELYSTAQNNGIFSNSTIVVGIVLEYVTTIILPTDTVASSGDHVTIVVNTTDTFNIVNSTGSFNGNQITIPTANITTTANNIILKISYISSIQDIYSSGITSLPISRIANGFSLNNSNGFNNNNIANLTRREFQPVQKNLSNQFYTEINLSSLDVSLAASQVISVIRLSDGNELWNNDNVGVVAINSSTNNYQLIFSGFNTPQAGDKVLAVYYADDIKRFQPFTFANKIIEKDFDSLQFDTVSNKFITGIHDFVSENNLTFQILEPNTDVILATANDGYIISMSNLATASFGSHSVNFGSLLDTSGKPLNILFKKIRILNAINKNNNNTYDITSYAAAQNLLTITNDFSKLSLRQISIIRLLDGQELWSDAGTIDLINNRLLFPATSNASTLDKVLILYYKFSNLKQTPTRLVLNVSDQVVNTGVLSISGTTITNAVNIVFTATSTGLKQNISEAIRDALGINSNVPIPTNIKIAKIAKLEKVLTSAVIGGEVLEVVATYDTRGSTIQDNTFYSNQFVTNQLFGAFDFQLPSTAVNTLAANIPKIGDKLRITFYYAAINDLENVNFTRNGILYTNKTFALINKLYVASGFKASQSARLTLSNFNQPITGSRYKVFYDYLAPKPNERIIIRYNNNKLISDVTFNIEASRPINADVLVRGAKQVLIDVTMNIVISPTSLSSSALVLQNLKDKLISTINSTSLGTTLDSSSLINAAFSVNGVAGARIIIFNKTGSSGQALSIQAQNDQFLAANNIILNQVSA